MKKIIIGLVGTSGSGKNEVAKCFSKRGCFIIDADLIGTETLYENEKKIIQMFENYSAKIKDVHGNLNKKEFAKLLFSNPKLLNIHEKFLLPLIEKKIRNIINNAKEKLIVLNAPTLHKTKLINDTDFFVYVNANYFLRLLRVKKRDARPLKDIILRFKNQKVFFTAYKNTNKKIYIIKNNFSKKHLQKKVDKILESEEQLKKLAK
ncbi:MAG: dephospho-CoA kinase [Treponemataceae bacterium]